MLRSWNFSRRIVTTAVSALLVPRLRQFYRHQGDNTGDDSFLESELAKDIPQGDQVPLGTPTQPLAERLAGQTRGDDASDEIKIELERLQRAPAKFEVMSSTSVFKWRTTAKYGRKLIGPMREWADEMQCRTGVHLDMDAVFPDKATDGDYTDADDVEVDVFLFGPDKAVHESVPLMRAMLKLDPAHVRCALYRKKADGEGVEWLTMRRINRENRPSDIPPISLKTPGKYTMLFENVEEAAVRTVFEETGVEITKESMTKTNVFSKPPVQFFWRPPVHYFIAEFPEGAEVKGPQSVTSQYLLDWDNRVLRMSKDPIDRAWATHADPKTGSAWLEASVIDELQKPVKLQENYMASRYTPPPWTNLQEVVKLGNPSDESQARPKEA